MRWPERVLIREVGPRDGLQNEKVILPTEAKISLIRALAKSGVTAIEATSFVHPRAVPQLSDAEAVLEGIGDLGPGVTISALVGNAKGMRRALGLVHTSLREIVVVVSASEAHNRANLNRTVDESLVGLKDIGMLAQGRFKVRGAVATAFGCPYEGQISAGAVAKVIEGMLAVGIREVALADTAGMGTPWQVYTLARQVIQDYPEVTWALHLHNTRGLALSNAVAGLMAGIGILESSIGGLGGCPFMPGAAGNVDTCDLVRLLHRMGIETGVDQRMVADYSRVVLKHLRA